MSFGSLRLFGPHPIAGFELRRLRRRTETAAARRRSPCPASPAESAARPVASDRADIRRRSRRRIPSARRSRSAARSNRPSACAGGARAGGHRLGLPGADLRDLEAAFVRLLIAQIALVLVERQVAARPERGVVFPPLERTLKDRDLRALVLPTARAPGPRYACCTWLSWNCGRHLRRHLRRLQRRLLRQHARARNQTDQHEQVCVAWSVSSAASRRREVGGIYDWRAEWAGDYISGSRSQLGRIAAEFRSCGNWHVTPMLADATSRSEELYHHLLTSSLMELTWKASESASALYAAKCLSRAPAGRRRAIGRSIRAGRRTRVGEFVACGCRPDSCWRFSPAWPPAASTTIANSSSRRSKSSSASAFRWPVRSAAWPARSPV